MAYVLWRVVMKKYSRVRLGLHKVPGLPNVTPTGRHAVTYNEESWKSIPEEQGKSEEPSKASDNNNIQSEDLSRSSEVRQSKTKRVKNYIKKCKNALGINSSDSSSHKNDDGGHDIEKDLEVIINKSEIRELDHVFEKIGDNSRIVENNLSDLTQVANVVNILPGDERCEGESGTETQSPFLSDVQEKVDSKNGDGIDEDQVHRKEVTEVKGEVACLVDRYFGDLYENYKNSRKCLVRQARDLLVCEYHGSLQRFESEFCIPAAKLLQYFKDKNGDSGAVPSGWPLCLGTSGVIVHLGPLSSTLVRHTDCYICIRTRSAPGLEIALIWRNSAQFHCQTIGEFKNPLQNLDEIMCSTLQSVMDIDNLAIDDSDGIELPELLQNLLISVEHAIERVPLDDLVNPCPQCLQYVPLDKQEQTSGDTVCSCQCSCRLPEAVVLKKDTSIQTSPMFEFAGPIPHIDSDEDEDRECTKTNSGKRVEEIEIPKRITDIPEKLLMSGINLPGTTDAQGRPIILCYAECIARAGLNKYEIAKVLLYYGSIPSTKEKEKGFTVLLLAETDEKEALLSLDEAIALVSRLLRIVNFLIWKPTATSAPRHLQASQLQGIVITDESILETYIKKDQLPASCGGSCTHDQLEWVEFIKQLEPFLNSCQAAGRALLSALSQLRSEEIPAQVNRRFLNHQCRQISKALQNETVQKLRREGLATFQSLEDRTQWLGGSRDVRRLANFANSSFTSVDRVAKKLEQLSMLRKERLKELARLRTLEDEAAVLLSWIRKVGDETLRSQTMSLRAAGDVASVKAVEKDFEKFYFDAMRQIDRVGDLVDESTNIPDVKGKNLKENASDLKLHVKLFGEKLEDVRENLEDVSRCLQLVESTVNCIGEGSSESENIRKVAFKTGNERLVEFYKNVQCGRDTYQPPMVEEDKADRLELHILPPDPNPVTSTPIKAQTQPLRRRSVSSIAFIYKCNHHAAGVPCNCHESDIENSVSYKLKKKYMQSLQNCGCGLTNSIKETLDRKNSLTLDGIKEVRESVENLLEKIDNSDSRLSGCGRCDSGVSTADNSLGDDSVYKKKLQSTCSCQFYSESCTLCSTGSSSTGSNQDHTENQQDSITEEGSDGFGKSGSDDIEDDHFGESRKKVPPISANSHLHCHASTFHLPVDSFDSHTDPKTQKTLLFIMREMIHTERDYVKSLDYIIENYIPELMREDIPQPLRGQRNVIFGNVEKIYEFHSQHFLRELEQRENNPLQVGQIFLKHSKKFYLYALYNKNKPKSDSLLSEYGTSFFKTKQLQLEDKMDLASYLLKPVQRMGKYALLLQQMMKACPPLAPGASERAIAEQDDLKQAEEMVRFQLRHGNDLLAMDSIRDCDVNLKEQGKLVRQNEFLVWEGRTGKKTLRQVFLFEELILFSKARRFPDRKNLDLFIYKNSIKLTDIGLTAKIGDSPTKFEIWFRKRKPNDTFTIQSTSEDIKKAWAEELSQLLWKQAIRNREARMVEMSSMGIGNKPCLDIRPSADQISDRSISFAQLSRTAPRFRNSIAGPIIESCRSTKRPHSVISMSSISSSSTSSGGSIGCNVTTPTSGPTPVLFESFCGSPKFCRRSGTLNSQCSTESGIIADISMGAEDCHENSHTYWPLEKSNSQHSTSSMKSNTTTPTLSDDTQITIYHVPEDLPVNI